MALTEANYPIASKGLAESFTESELPIEFALKFRNRTINAAGGAEKRRGMKQFGSTVPGTPSLDAIHELIAKNGTATLFVSGEGKIYSESGGTYTQVHSGLDASSPLQSVQMGAKLIFVNGVDRNFYTEDGSTFKELLAIIERGESDTGSDRDSLEESDIDNWVADSNVAINDLLFNADVSAYAVITAISTASVSHTQISASSASAIGVASRNQGVGDNYEIQDLVELNIIPQTNTEDDNLAVAASGTDDNTVDVSAVPDWAATDIRVGDYIRNTTRAALGRVTTVSALSIKITGISGQTTGDSLIFLKSAMPVATFEHVHFGRLYMVDERDQRKVRITGAANPEDMTTNAGTLDSSTFKYGEQQPLGDSVVAMGSYQRFLAIAGRQNMLLFEGTDPIADTTAKSTDFNIIGLFPQGVISPAGLVSTGNDLVYTSADGIQSLSLADDASTLARANLSEALKTTLRDLFASTGAAEIIAFHYPRRSWLCFKVGSRIYVFNYTAFFGVDPRGVSRGEGLSTQSGSWSLFDGKFARQKAFFVRADGTLLCCGDGGKVYEYDVKDVYDDDGEVYTTEYQTGWLTGDEPERRVRRKQGHYIKPIIDAGSNITYTILAEAGFDAETTETITFTASGGATPIGLAIVGNATIGGSSIQNIKYPLRWRGEQVRLTFTTNDNQGPDVLSRFTLYATRWGRG